MVQNMVKYYGEPGARLGKYRSTKLGVLFSTDEFLDKWGDRPAFDSPAKDIHAYLSRSGSFVSIEACQKKKHLSGSYVYHYGGATVVVNYSFLTSLSEAEEAGYVTVRLASNGPLDYVIERLHKKFPYLQQGESFDGID